MSVPTLQLLPLVALLDQEDPPFHTVDGWMDDFIYSDLSLLAICRLPLLEYILDNQL
jgi:hypothetical protein